MADPEVISLTIEYRGREHTIRLPAVTKEDGIRELKSMAMSAKDGFLADTIDWLFNDLWIERPHGDNNHAAE